MSRYDFPECCAKCLAEGPTQAWKISGSEHKLGAANSTVTVISATHPPVCEACYRGLTGLSWLCWIVACSIAGPPLPSMTRAPTKAMTAGSAPPTGSAASRTEPTRVGILIAGLV